jgi:hypothetical protein
LPRQLRNPPRRPRRPERVHLFLHVREIDFDQLLQAVEERAGLLLRASPAPPNQVTRRPPLGRFRVPVAQFTATDSAIDGGDHASLFYI